jgi:hypothetical protein
MTFHEDIQDWRLLKNPWPNPLRISRTLCFHRLSTISILKWKWHHLAFMFCQSRLAHVSSQFCSGIWTLPVCHQKAAVRTHESERNTQRSCQRLGVSDWTKQEYEQNGVPWIVPLSQIIFRVPHLESKSWEKRSAPDFTLFPWSDISARRSPRLTQRSTSYHERNNYLSKFQLHGKRLRLKDEITTDPSALFQGILHRSSIFTFRDQINDFCGLFRQYYSSPSYCNNHDLCFGHFSKHYSFLFVIFLRRNFRCYLGFPFHSFSNLSKWFTIFRRNCLLRSYFWDVLWFWLLIFVSSTAPAHMYSQISVHFLLHVWFFSEFHIKKDCPTFCSLRCRIALWRSFVIWRWKGFSSNKRSSFSCVPFFVRRCLRLKMKLFMRVRGHKLVQIQSGDWIWSL